MGDREGLEHSAAALKVPLELVEQARLAHTRLAQHRHNLPSARLGCLPCPLELLHLPLPAHEAHQPPLRSHLKPRAQRSHALQLEDPQRLLHALYVEAAEIAQAAEPLDHLGRVLG